MVDVSPSIVTALSTILPTQYELFCDSQTTQPCITYTVNNNYSYIESDKLGYSKVSYNIKLWGKDYAILNTHVATVDSKMRELGFKRTSYGELCTDLQFCLILIYEGTGKEDFN